MPAYVTTIDSCTSVHHRLISPRFTRPVRRTREKSKKLRRSQVNEYGDVKLTLFTPYWIITYAAYVYMYWVVKLYIGQLDFFILWVFSAHFILLLFFAAFLDDFIIGSRRSNFVPLVCVYLMLIISLQIRFQSASPASHSCYFPKESWSGLEVNQAFRCLFDFQVNHSFKTRFVFYKSFHRFRSPLLGACNSHNKPMQRHFYRPVYF